MLVSNTLRFQTISEQNERHIVFHEMFAMKGTTRYM